MKGDVDTIRHRVASVENLEEAFVEIRERRVRLALPLPSGLRDVELHLEDRLRELSDEIRSGTWEPAALRSVRIPKGDGTWRKLRVPPVRDRIVERALARVVSEIVDPELSPWSFAYRRGLGVEDALRAVRDLRESGLEVVVQADVEDCFDSIPGEVVLAEVERRIHDPWLLATVACLIGRPSYGSSERSRPIRGVPQGAPLSPLLANLVLDEFDTEMAAAGFVCVRYADDLLVAVESESAARAATECARTVLSKAGLTVNDDKVRIGSFDDGVSFLGEEIGPANLHEELVEMARRLRREERRALYVTRQGAYVAARHGQLRVTHHGAELLSLPVAMVNPLVLCGAVTLSAGARSMVLHEGVEVVFLSKRGRYLGRLDASRGDSARLRRTQYAVSGDPDRRLRLARTVVAGKIANQRALVMRYARRQAVPHVQGAVRALLENRRAALVAQSMDELLGVEGIAARTYFGALGRMLPGWTEFSGRNRRPPRDPVNSVLSFGYALLVSECVAAVRVAGLDPSCGFVHADDGDRPSLALDLMEEFRPLVVDTVVLELFRRRQLDENDFRAENGAVYLGDAARRLVIESIEMRLVSEFSHVPSGRRTTYRRAIALQAGQVASWVRGGLDEYEPVPWR